MSGKFGSEFFNGILNNTERKKEDQNSAKMMQEQRCQNNGSSINLMENLKCRQLLLFVNGKEVRVDNVDPRTTLAAFLRDQLKLCGTKIGCNEGGCGACTVMVSDIEPVEKKIRHYSVNACLTPVCAMFNKAVTTVEGISAGYKRLHPVQERLSRTHGSQCGYCTPGFVMAMYSLLRNNPMPSQAEVDECLQGNLCRCTGYRPILEAFYSFTRQDGSIKSAASACNGAENGCCGMKENCCMQNGVKNEEQNGQDGEKRCRKLLNKLSQMTSVEQLDPSQELIFPPELAKCTLPTSHKTFVLGQFRDYCWLQPSSIPELLEILKTKLARIVAGNTEIGVEQKFKNIKSDDDHPKVMVNIKQIAELRKTWADDEGIWLGSALSLNEVKQILQIHIQKLPSEHTTIFRSVVEILHLFAGHHIRNMATIAGNIATASPISDLNPIWMATGAQILLESAERGERKLKLDTNFFLSYRKTAIASDELIRAIHIPFTRANQYFRTFKQAQRREDDIAIVTGAFFVEFDNEETAENGTNAKNNKEKRICKMQMAFGGVGPTTRLATNAVKNLQGMPWDTAFFDLVSARLAEEFCVPEDAPGGMAKYRQTLVLSFFLKFYLCVRELLEIDGARAEKLATFLNESENQFQSTQIYQDVPNSQSSTDPVGRPLMHDSGEKHTTGEAVYTTDVPLPHDCLHMAFVLAPMACGTIESLDYGEVEKMMQQNDANVVGFVDWRDVPGSLMIGHSMDTPVFAKKKISYQGQPLAAIVALDHEAARRAASRVQVKLVVNSDSRNEKPIVTIEEAIEKGSFLLPSPLRIHSSLALPEACERTTVDWSKFQRVVEGQIRVGGQEHFYLETQNCLVVPGEGDEMRVICSTQAVNDVQGDVACVLGIPRNVVSVSVRRIGGGFGGKESSCGLFAAAAAVAAKKFKRPVRFWLERFDDMAISGNRHPFRFDYRFALDANGKFAAMEVNAFSNCGYSWDLSRGVMERTMAHIDSVYKFGNLDVFGHLCRTNLASNTAFRGFGAPQAMFGTETILKHAAEQFGLDVDQMREQNLYSEGDHTHFGMHLRQCNIRRCWTECRQWAKYDERKSAVERWNSQNRFVKRGIYLVPTKFGIAFGFKRLNQAGALVHVYTDGSVLISHGGMEMGQGLHTKILQIAARCLGIDISMIQIIETATDKVPNASPTAASVGSDVNGLAVQNACETILKRLEPLRAELPKGAGWKELVAHAYASRVQLSATGFGLIHCEPVNFAEGKGAEYYGYFVYGVGCAEVELDCLTGDHRLLRVDIVMDVGDSLNPAIDIGQIEGAFVQGYGLFTMEELKVRPDGTRLTRGPGTYKIPSADDAPRKFHVKLLAGSSNKSGIFSSKAVGEPPLFLGSAAFFAIREAIRAYRLENGCPDGYFRLDSPATPERIRMACEDGITRKASSIASRQPWTVEL